MDNSLSISNPLSVLNNIYSNHTKNGVRNTDCIVVYREGEFLVKERLKGLDRLILLLRNFFGLTSCAPEYKRSERKIEVVKKGLRDALINGHSIKGFENAIRWYFRDLRGDKSFNIEAIERSVAEEKAQEKVILKKALIQSKKGLCCSIPKARALTEAEIRELHQEIDHEEQASILKKLEEPATNGNLREFSKLWDMLKGENRDLGLAKKLISNYIGKYFEAHGSEEITFLSEHLKFFGEFGQTVFQTQELARIAKGFAYEILSERLNSDDNFKKALAASPRLDGVLGELKSKKLQHQAKNRIRLGISPDPIKDEFVSIYDKPKLLKSPHSNCLAIQGETKPAELVKMSKIAKFIQKISTSCKKVSEPDTKSFVEASKTGNKITRLFRQLVKK
jgi:hypothetical protein